MRLPLLILHISGGMIGLLAGAVAMIYRKGSWGHRAVGNVFVVSMLIMGACGSVLAVMKHEPNNVFGGVLTFYMVTTAWLAGRRNDKDAASIIDYAALVMALALGSTLITLGVRIVTGQTAPDDGVPIFMYFFMGTIPLLAAAGDIRMLVRGISGKQRIARHLWRMCFGWFIATGSFFLGQQQVFPASWQGSPALLVPALTPLVLLIFWLIRVHSAKAYRRIAPLKRTAALSLSGQ